MADQLCDSCGEYLPEGSAKYTVHIQAVADFDGIIYTEDNTSLEEEVTGSVFASVEEMGEEVFQEVAFILCDNCKRKFLLDPFNRGTNFFKVSKNIKYLFH
jgi:hypothetical protein